MISRADEIRNFPNDNSEKDKGTNISVSLPVPLFDTKSVAVQQSRRGSHGSTSTATPDLNVAFIGCQNSVSFCALRDTLLQKFGMLDVTDDLWGDRWEKVDVVFIIPDALSGQGKVSLPSYETSMSVQNYKFFMTIVLPTDKHWKKKLDPHALNFINQMFSASHTVREVERPLTFGNVQKLFGFIRNYRGRSSRSSVSSSESKASVSHAKGNVTSSNAEETKPVPVTTTQSSIDEKLCSSQTASFKVLVVEDNPINAKIVTALLRRAGIDFLEAVNGEEGVEMFKRELPAVVLLDINMPKMNGFDAAVAMRAHPSPYQHHIAAVTALSSEADRVRGFEAGMDARYTKPMRMGRLIEEVQKLREAGHSPQTISSSSSPV